MRKKLSFILLFILLVAMTPVLASAASVGDHSYSPDAGWQRYDDRNPSIQYAGVFTQFDISGYYSNTNTGSIRLNDYVTFKFKGTKLRILDYISSNRSENIDVTIDGLTENYSAKGSNRAQVIVYEKTGLADTVHTVVITNKVSGAYLSIDAIDIDDTGYLIYSSNSPTNLVASVGNAQVGLTWDNVYGAESYNIYRSLVQGGPYSLIGSSNGTTYDDTDVQNSTTYYYVVTAEFANLGESNYSNEVTATPEEQNPDAPANLTALGGGMKITLSWNEVEEAVFYQVKRSFTEGGPYTVIGSVYDTTYTDTEVEVGTTYYYVVTANNENGESAPSNEASSTPYAPEPATRALLTLYLAGGQVKGYDVSVGELDAFLNWFDTRAAGTGPERYGFEKTWNKGPFKARTEYVIFSKINTFDVDEYEIE